MRNRCLGLFLLLFLPLVSPASAESTAKKTGQIRESCSNIDLQIKNNSLVTLYFAVLAGAQPDAWTEFHSLAELEAACSKGFSRKATVYSKDSNILLAALEAKGPAKEWVHYLKYYFRDDGSLEKIHSDFRRFGAYQRDKGDEQQFLVKVIRDRYYDSTGKCIKKSGPRFFNTSTGREMTDVVFKDVSWPVYSNREKLPFYALIQAAPASTPTKQP